jgi:hypothetical protein
MTTSQPDTTLEASRRDFLKLAWLGLGALALAESRGWPWPFLARLAEGDFGEIHHRRSRRRFPAWLRHPFSTRGAFTCHAGRWRLSGPVSQMPTWAAPSLAAAPGKFLCPCHASAFDAKGDVLNPPAPRALDLFPVIIDNGQVKVDTGTVVQRDKFDPSQVVYPRAAGEREQGGGGDFSPLLPRPSAPLHPTYHLPD